MIKVRIALALLIGVLINSSCSKTSIEDICSNMNTYEGSYNWESYIKSNGWKFKNCAKTKDGLKFVEVKVEIPNQNIFLSYKNHEENSLFEVNYWCTSIYYYFKNDENKLNFTEKKPQKTCFLAFNYPDEIIKNYNNIVENLFLSKCIKVDGNQLHFYFEGYSKYNIITFEKL